MDLDAEDEFAELEPQYAVRPNKSALKRESAELEKLGEALIALPKEHLGQIGMNPALHDAVALAQNIANHHGAFKRQRKFITKLLREAEAEDLAAIRAQLKRQTRQDASAVRQLHNIEHWRDRLLAGGDQDLNALLAEHLDADRQKLRQLLRDARKERQAEAPPRSARLLFKYLRELMAAEEIGQHDDETLEE